MKTKITGKTAEILFLLFVFAAEAVLAANEAFGMMPDEFSHFEVVYYIYRHGIIPTGYEPQIQVPYWGASYAFQPVLAYMIQGWLMRFIDLFTDNIYILALSARLVDCIFGVIMAWFVRQISKLMWDGKTMQWLFTFMVVLLPENLYIHSYINTDSMAAMSVAIIIYAMLKGEEDDYSRRTMVLLSAGISICLLSYYNAYGAVLTAFICFFVHFLSAKRYRAMWGKAGFVALLVLIMAGWWFIRSGILYNGDIFGLSARRALAVREAEPQYSPLTKQTFAGQGISLKDMLLSNDYLKLVYRSFICVMGNFDIQTSDMIYTLDKYLIAAAALLALVPAGDTVSYWHRGNKRRAQRVYVEILLSADIVITLFMHMIYSYGYDWQPQGRYLLPMLIPLMYFLALGADKGGQLIQRAAGAAYAVPGEKGNKRSKAAGAAVTAVRIAIMSYIVFTVVYTLKVHVLPLYFGDADFRSYAGRTWQQVIPQFMMK